MNAELEKIANDRRNALESLPFQFLAEKCLDYVIGPLRAADFSNLGLMDRLGLVYLGKFLSKRPNAFVFDFDSGKSVFEFGKYGIDASNPDNVVNLGSAYAFSLMNYDSTYLGPKPRDFEPFVDEVAIPAMRRSGKTLYFLVSDISTALYSFITMTTGIEPYKFLKQSKEVQVKMLSKALSKKLHMPNLVDKLEIIPADTRRYV